MSEETPQNSKSPSKNSEDSNNCTVLLGKPHVTVTVLDYGTDITGECSFNEEQVLHEHQVWIPKQGTGKQISEIIKRYVKVVLPGYTGQYRSWVNPVDEKRVTEQMNTLTLDELESYGSSQGSFFRLLGHVYVLLLDPLGHPRSHPAGPKEVAEAKKESTNRLESTHASKPPDDDVEPAPKRSRF